MDARSEGEQFVSVTDDWVSPIKHRLYGYAVPIKLVIMHRMGSEEVRLPPRPPVSETVSFISVEIMGLKPSSFLLSAEDIKPAAFGVATVSGILTVRDVIPLTCPLASLETCPTVKVDPNPGVWLAVG